MMGQKTLSEIRAELRSSGIDPDRLRQELTQLFEQPRKDKTTAQILASLAKSMKPAKPKKRRVTSSKAGKSLRSNVGQSDR